MRPAVVYRPQKALKPGDSGFRGLTPEEKLAHKLALKAAQMRRYRARKAGTCSI